MGKVFYFANLLVPIEACIDCGESGAARQRLFCTESNSVSAAKSISRKAIAQRCKGWNILSGFSACHFSSFHPQNKFGGFISDLLTESGEREKSSGFWPLETEGSRSKGFWHSGNTCAMITQALTVYLYQKAAGSRANVCIFSIIYNYRSASAGRHVATNSEWKYSSDLKIR